MSAREGMGDLRERCVELREWHKTGILRGGKLRDLAKSLMQYPSDLRLTMAERQTEKEALDFVISTPAPVFDMEAAVEAVARKMAINIRHDPDGWGMTVDGVRFKIWEVLRDRAHEMIDIVCRHLQPDMEALRRENDSFRDALESIRQYGSDTLSGRVDGPDDRSWQREGVLEMTKRAHAALAAQAGKQGGG